MSIKDRQLKQATTSVMTKYLTKGQFPDAPNVQRDVQNLFKERPAGLPRYIFTPIGTDELSSSAAFNKMTANIHEDLTVAFDETWNNSERLVSTVQLYDTEKKGIKLLLKKLDKRVMELEEKLNSGPKRNVITDTFHDFNQIDFIGNSETGIPVSDAWVDLKQERVTLNNIHIRSKKYNLANAAYVVNVVPSQKDGVTLAEETIFPLGYALNDMINETWQHVVKSSSVEKVSLSVKVDIGEKLEANQLSLEFQSPKTTRVRLLVSENDVDYKALETHSDYDSVEWMFSETVQYLQFYFEKDEPDFTDGTTYEYHFGASNIALRKEVYLPTSTLVSKPYVITEPIEKITLRADDVVYPQTYIRYYLGVEAEDSYTEWQELRPDETILISQMNREQKLIDSTQEGYGEFYSTSYGVNYHKIADLSYQPTWKHSSIYKGEYMWQVETRSINLEGSYSPSLEDWKIIKGAVKTYLPIEDTIGTRSFPLSPDTLQRFTTHVYCESEEELYNIDLFAGSVDVKVYVNNTLLKPIMVNLAGHNAHRLNYRFAAGWNKIEILTHTKGEQTLKPNLYLRDISTKVYASREPLKEVGLYDLLNNTSKIDDSKYAIEGTSVIVNYDPKERDETGAGIRYDMDYAYLPPGMVSAIKIRFMSVLTGSPQDDKVTPILNHYKLIME